MNPPSSGIADAPGEVKAKDTTTAESPRKKLSAEEILRQAAKNSQGKNPKGGKPAPKRSAFSREAMQWTRRLHLYTGLFLLPWVFLYGVTGILFNHPTWFSDTFQATFSQDAVEGTSLAGLLPATDIAQSVVARLNEENDTSYALVEPESISFGRTGLNATVVGADQKDYQVILNKTGDGGVIREPRRRGGGGSRGPGGNQPRATGDEPSAGYKDSQGSTPGPDRGQGRSRGEEGGARGRRGNGQVSRMDAVDRPHEGGNRGAGRNGSQRSGAAPFAVDSGFEVAASPIALFEESLPTILARSGFEGATISAVNLEPLSFKIKDGEKTWNVQYDVARGSISGTEDKPGDEAEQLSSMSFRRYLLQLHKARGYPDEEVNVRSVWAVFVDAMSFTMCFWGISGIVMWWQIKRTRPIGTALLLLSVALAGLIGYVMWVEMVS